MDYRSLLAIPLAALALGASSAETWRLPSGWQAGSSFTWPAGRTYQWGVAPDTDGPADAAGAAGARALSVQSVGQRHARELGAVWQSVTGYAGKRVRFTAQVKARGADTWAGLVLREGFLPPYVLPADPAEAAPAADAGAPACPDWCEVSVVADIPSDRYGAVTVGLALIGNGQVWARGFKLEVVGAETPVTPQRFAAAQTDALRDDIVRQRQAQAAPVAKPTPPQNLALQ